MPDPEYQSDPIRTARRRAGLSCYFRANVTASATLICPTAARCRASHNGDFYEAQLHHVGRHYELVRDGKSLRVVVVGQEYGHGPAFVSLDDRYDMVVNRSGLQRRFKTGDGRAPRNPHMRGCTSLLRLIFGLGLGPDHEGEFLNVGGDRVHVFDCFALVNFLLCSATPASGRATREWLGGKPGRSTRKMRAACSSHFRAALEILEPTLIIAQGYRVRSWIADTFDLPARRPQDGVEQLQIGGAAATLVSFSHPSAHGALNWGLNERMPYLLNTVAPTITRAVGGRVRSRTHSTQVVDGLPEALHSCDMPDRDILAAALIGYRQKRAELDAAIADLRRRLDGGAPVAAAAQPKPAKKKRHLSPEGRARIIAATKKRWAALRRAKAKAAKKK